MDQNNPNTQFGSLIRAHKDDFEFIGRKDRRMRFNNARDPIYYVFDVVDNRPLQAIAKDFVKDSFSEIANFISKAVR